MARDEDVVADESGPLLYKGGQGNGLVNFGGARIPPNFEAVAHLRCVLKATLVK